ncbi:MAG: DNA mismatch repair endonuclease MutL, partial [Acidobacteria bacterium]|nr:DNA mismatch repair endonuclease MutL [Acidobacteriota bacterium]
MNEITVLSDIVINKISAGEVVERPASVVKELIENSIDAGADKIFIEVEDSGKNLILVEDNGRGISREDLPLSLTRYATSKIRSEEDLNSIATLGFRGEALAAICAVSKVRIESRKSNSPNGFAIEGTGGKIGEVVPVGAKEGTRIAVKDLFYNTPARNKFLKSDPVEMSHIISLVESYCLTKPKISFSLKANGSTVIEVSPAQSGKERFFDLFPEFSQSDFRDVKNNFSSFSVDGIAGEPSKNFSSFRYIFTSVNGRFVRDKLINSAILKSYEEMMPKGRYPIVFLAICLPCEEVDVNVHPTKKEIKFRQPHIVYDFIYKNVLSAFRPSQTFNVYPQAVDNEQRTQPGKIFVESVKESPSLFEKNSGRFAPLITVSPPPSVHKVIAVWRKGFIILDSPKGISIVDQHTLHERLRFEEFRHFIERKGEKKQFLETRCYAVPRNLKSRIEELCSILNDHG